MRHVSVIAGAALAVLLLQAVYHLVGETIAWLVILPVLVVLLVLLARTWRQFNKTRQEALRDLERARRWRPFNEEDGQAPGSFPSNHSGNNPFAP